MESNSEAHYEDRYPPVTDFQLIYKNLHSLVFLGDDHFMGMQAMNLSLVDGFITEHEEELRAEYIRLEKVPLPLCMFVSAQSQMWTFAVYELLRTWRQRLRKYQKWSTTGGIPLFIQKLKSKRSPAAIIQMQQAEAILKSPSVLEIARQHVSATENAFEISSLLRLTLAKHEMPGGGDIPDAPGYGTINLLCGSMTYQVQKKGGFATLINRRDLADALRAIKAPESELN